MKVIQLRVCIASAKHATSAWLVNKGERAARAAGLQRSGRYGRPSRVDGALLHRACDRDRS